MKLTEDRIIRDDDGNIKQYKLTEYEASYILDVLSYYNKEPNALSQEVKDELDATFEISDPWSNYITKDTGRWTNHNISYVSIKDSDLYVAIPWEEGLTESQENIYPDYYNSGDDVEEYNIVRRKTRMIEEEYYE